MSLCCLLALVTFSSRIHFAKIASDGVALSQPLTIAWRYGTDQTTDLTPGADAATIFAPLSGGVLVALNADDGKLLWKSEAGGEFSTPPRVGDRSVYVATRYSEPDQRLVHGTLRALSKSTGVTLWMHTLPAPIEGSLVVGGDAVFAGSHDGRVYSFDKRTGLTRWLNEYGEEFSGQPALAGNVVYFGSKAGTLRAINEKTGQLIWQYKARGPIQGPIAVKNTIVYFGSGDGNVYAFSESKAKLLWHRRTGAAVQAVVAVENGLLAASLDNFAYLLSFNKGSLIWRRQLPGRISSRPITADDGALFTPFSTDSAIVLNLKDGKTVNTLPLGEENSSSAAPIIVRNFVIITTPHALLAFAAPRQK